jgi:hypothetical protein
MRAFFSRRASGVYLTFFILIVFASCASAQNMFRKVNDFDGDGKADFAVTRAENGFKYWWIWQTTAGPRVAQWGLTLDRDAAGDYDGDGKTDLAVWRPRTNSDTTYYILESQNNTYREQSFNNLPVSTMMHQDYNGDGKTDTGVITGEVNRSLYVVYSGIGSGFTVPVPPPEIGIRIGDFDGDGRADKASYRFDNGFQRQAVTIQNLVTGAQYFLLYGVTGDQFQMADFDGDGIGDLTVYRPSDGTWWWRRSSDSGFRAAQWGQSGDTPVPADYDGDGKTDLAIFRRGSAESPQSYYWIYGSQNGVMVVQWGTSTDSAVTY